METQKKRRGDRKDGRLMRELELPALRHRHPLPQPMRQ